MVRYSRKFRREHPDLFYTETEAFIILSDAFPPKWKRKEEYEENESDPRLSVAETIICALLKNPELSVDDWKEGDERIAYNHYKGKTPKELRLILCRIHRLLSDEDEEEDDGRYDRGAYPW